jgi:hypothetical protein
MTYVAHPDPNDVSYHGGPAKWKAVDTPSAALRDDPSIPTSQMFSEGNGGESRKSFHGACGGANELDLGATPRKWLRARAPPDALLRLPSQATRRGSLS